MNSPMPADQPAPPRPSSLADQPASSSSPPEPASAAEQYARLRGVAIGLLDQALELLRTAVDSDALLTAVSELVPGSTVGKHLRHLHDHFRILLAAAHDPARPQTLNYDSRERNVPMESSHSTVLAEFDRLKQILVSPASPFNQPAPPCPSANTPAAPFRHDGPLDLVAITPHEVSLKTTFNRELWFACLHATHHYALIRVIVTGELRRQLPKEFGVAPSTLERSKM